MIPEKAVTAGAKVLRQTMEALQPAFDNADMQLVIDLNHVARMILEAAAPHMFAPVLALADEMDNVHGSIRGHVTTYQLRQALGVNDD